MEDPEVEWEGGGPVGYTGYHGNQDEIACQFSRRTYAQTSLVTCHIHAGRICKETQDPTLARCYVQASGHIFIDQKWAKLTGNISDVYKEKTPGLHLFHKNIKAPLLAKPPSSPSIHAYCLLVTQQEPVPLEQLRVDGYYVQVELPGDLIPSYRGLTARVIYNVNVVIVRTDLAKPKIFSFPFAVCSKGCAKKPYELKFCYLGLYESRHLSPSDRLQSIQELSDPIDTADEEVFFITPENNISRNKIMYGEECIGLLKYSERIYVATFVNINFDLDETTKFFDVLRIRFVQTEYREDGTRVEEKVMSTMVRTCRHALRLNHKLPLPPQYGTSFVAPTVEVKFHLDVEFFEAPTDENPHSEPISWNFPVQVVQNPPYRSIKGEMLACVESSVCLDHYAI